MNVQYNTSLPFPLKIIHAIHSPPCSAPPAPPDPFAIVLSCTYVTWCILGSWNKILWLIYKLSMYTFINLLFTDVYTCLEICLHKFQYTGNQSMQIILKYFINISKPDSTDVDWDCYTTLHTHLRVVLQHYWPHILFLVLMCLLLLFIV